MKRFLYFLFLLSLGPMALHAQSNGALLDIVGGANDTVPCNQPCKTVNANYVKPLQTNTYQVGNVAFNPVALTTSTTLSLGDDKFSGAIQIGFPFCFYTNQYSQLYISANGHITFNPAYALGNCSFDTKQAMPFYNASYPDNAIFCPFTDGNTSAGGTIKYATTGTAPFRKFVVQYSNIPFFGAACTGSPATFQCVLSETHNTIEVFITNKSTCNTDPTNYLNYATVGIQNTSAVNAVTAPNRNAAVWSASNEGWKFSPAGPPAYNMAWYVSGMNVANNTPSISVCNPFPRTVISVLTLSCPARTERDTIVLHKFAPNIDTVLVTKTSCKNTSTGTATVIVSLGTPPYTYSIDGNPFVQSNTFYNLSFGNHYVQVKDANGCTHTYSFFVGTTSTLAATIASAVEPYCPLANGSINANASGGLPPYTYLWNTNATTPNISNLPPGTYQIQVTDANGCIETASYILKYNPASVPFVTDSTIKPVCGDSTGHIYTTVVNGTLPYIYNWSNNANTPNLHNVPSGLYTVIVTDANGCSGSRAVALNDTLNMQIQITGVAHTKCGLNNGIATCIATNGLPPYSYLWSNAAITPSTNTLSSGWQFVTVQDANNCTRKDSVNLNASTPVTIQFLPADAYCLQNNGLINTIISGNTGSISYLWNTSQATPLIDSLAAGKYILTVTDSVGCVGIDSVTLINKGLPKLVVVEYIKPLCSGDSTGRLLLSGTQGVPPYKYSFDGINFSGVALITSFSAGTYTIYIRDANSCISDTTITFEPPKAIDISLGFVDTLVCYHHKTGDVSLFANDGTPPYLWSQNGTDYSTNNIVNNLSVGANTIWVKDSNNCINQKDINVPGPPAPLEMPRQIEAVPCYQVNGGSIDASVTGGWPPYQYNWYHTTSTDLMQIDLAAGIYKLNVIDTRGCVADSLMRVPQLYCCDCYFPNAFTPNGDANNDIFRAISPASDIESYQLSVYNRWGARIFSTTNIKDGWDGRIGGTTADIGTYYYQCKLKCQNKKNDVYLKGEVTLIR